MIDYFIAILFIALFLPVICSLLFMIDDNGGDKNDKT